MTAFYNEIDPNAAQWLRNLIAAGHIAPGVVDERSIEDITPDELRGFTQCHFFAGVGVWSLALRDAGWADNRPIWTGSAPCQPFSAAGAGAGFADERHLWPAFHHLIAECLPAVVAGEQVASKAVDPWIDLVQDDLEALGYAVGAVAFPSAGIGAPHIRDRTYWVGHAHHQRPQGGPEGTARPGQPTAVPGGALRLAHPQLQQRPDRERGVGSVNEARGRQQGAAALAGFRSVERLADTEHHGRGGQESDQAEPRGNESGIWLPDGRHSVPQGQPAAGPTNGQWRDADWLFCRDGKWRPVEPGTFPLAHGVASRVGRLRAYGNAINKEAARVFIECAFPELQRPSVMDLI